MTSSGRFSTARNSDSAGSGCSRRDVLRGALGASLMAMFSGRLGAQEAARARACILVWLDGGPSHLDTFDPKPGTRVAGPVQAIPTAIEGVRFAQYLPRLAERAGDLAVVRGLTSREAEHERATYLMHTGWSRAEATSYPSMGSVYGRVFADRSAVIPAYITIGADTNGREPGFLGDPYAAFALDSAYDRPFRMADADQLARRRDLLRAYEDRFDSAHATAEERRELLDRAERYMSGPLMQALELEGVSEEERGKYGEQDFGLACLQAVRLVESGARFVEVALGGWDTHVENFTEVEALAGALDTAAAAMLDDLRSRGLLESTLVIVMGEFGRTPTINERNGRDHHAEAFSAVLAGGGVRAGQPIGTTDAEGREVADRAVAVRDLFATVAVLSGIDPARQFYTPEGRPIRVVEEGAVPIAELI